MVYIKVNNESGELVSVEALSSPVFVKNQRNGVIIRCEAPQAQGILDSTEQEIYQIKDREELPGCTRTAELITQGEYDILAEDYPEPNPVPEEGEPDTPPLTVGEMRLQLAQQAAAIDTLTGCVLEMSELVYG